jgi:hypothetical protein
VSHLLSFNADPNLGIPSGWFPLAFSIINGYPQIVSLLVDHGASVNASTPYTEQLALGLAVEKGYIELLNKILPLEQSPFLYCGGYNLESVSILFGQPIIWWNLFNKSKEIDLEELPVSSELISANNKEHKSDSQIVSSRTGSTDILLVKKLGSGHFGDIWEGKRGERRIAVKCLQMVSDKDTHEMLEEISLLG